jgi:retron-type reverse transcriptase
VQSRLYNWRTSQPNRELAEMWNASLKAVWSYSAFVLDDNVNRPDGLSCIPMQSPTSIAYWLHIFPA